MGTVHPLSPPEGVLAAVTAAVEAMHRLGPADRGMVALALEYARRIDDAEDDKGAGYLGQNLSGILRALGGAPAERKALGVEEQVAGKLAALRGRRSS
ncbi:terminase small subunit [Blastococcus sp. SYSU DS0617]